MAAPLDADHSPALVIASGDLPSFLAAWTEGVCAPPPAAGVARSTVSAPILWVHPLASEVARAASLSWLSRCEIPTAATGRSAFRDDLIADAPHLEPTAVLLAAGLHALAAGVSRIVWPVVVGPPMEGAGTADRRERLGRVADVYDRALLVGRLLSVNQPGTGLSILTPYVEFSDTHLLDLAIDLDAPVPACAVCERAEPLAPLAGEALDAGPSGVPDRGPIVASAGRTPAGALPCGQCVSCRRWTLAAESLGLRLVDVLEAPLHA